MENCKFIIRDGKRMYGNFGGHLKEATMENIEADIAFQERILDNERNLYWKFKKELDRLRVVKEAISSQKLSTTEKSK